MTKVKIYTTQTCGYCRAAKEFMADNKVDFEEIDVSSNVQKAREMIEKSGQMGVPVLVVDKDGQEEVIVGFDQNRIAEVLGINA